MPEYVWFFYLNESKVFITSSTIIQIVQYIIWERNICSNITVTTKYPALHPISPHLAAGKHIGTITLVTISNHLWNYQEYKLEICIVMSHHISTVTGHPATLPQPLPCTTLHHLSCEIKKEGLSHMGLGPGNAAALLQYTVWAIIGDCKQCIAVCSIAALLSDTIALVLGTPGTGDSFIHCNSSWSQLLWSMCASFPPLVGSIAYIPALPTCTKMCIIKSKLSCPYTIICTCMLAVGHAQERA